MHIWKFFQKTLTCAERGALAFSVSAILSRKLSPLLLRLLRFFGHSADQVDTKTRAWFGSEIGSKIESELNETNKRAG